MIKEYEQLPYVECYPGEINQVMINIFSNAIEAFEQEEDIFNEENIQQNQLVCTTGYNQSMSHIIVCIKDNAGGIKPEFQSQIFEHFFTTKQVKGNVGLGLSISKEIVEDRHQGKLDFVSYPEEGVEFIIELPIT